MTIICFGCWAVNDALMKLVMRSLPELQTVFIRNLFVTPLLALIALSRGELLLAIAKSERWKVLGRVLGDVFTTYFVLAAIHGGHLANVAVILGAQPLLIMLGAATCLGERVDRVAWAFGLLGMLGVVLAAQPSKLSGLSLSSLLALLAVASGTVRDLLARQISSAVPATQIATLAAFTILSTAGLVGLGVGDWESPSAADVGLCAAAALLLAGALIGSVVAMRTGDVGFVQPFRYSYIVWAMLLGVVLFDHYPDVITLAGAAIVAGCGIGSLCRERRRGRQTSTAGVRLEETAPEEAVTPGAQAKDGTAAMTAASQEAT